MKVRLILFVATTIFISSASNYKIQDVTKRETHRCRNPSIEVGIVSLDCSDLNLLSVPIIPESQSVKMFDLSFNKLTKLNNESFQSYSKLTAIYLFLNEITEIEVNTFSNLDSLRILVLSNNKLTFIDPNTFAYNRHLWSLELQNNSLSPDFGRPIIVSKSLKILDLSFCQLTQLSEESFSEVPELQDLDLRYNKLQQLSLKHLENVHDLMLEGNPWKCDCNFYDLLKTLSLSKKTFSDIGFDKVIQCQYGNKLLNLTTKQDKNSICRRSEVATVGGTIPIEEEETFNSDRGNPTEYYGETENEESEEPFDGSSWTNLHVENLVICVAFALIMGLLAFFATIAVYYIKLRHINVSRPSIGEVIRKKLLLRENTSSQIGKSTEYLIVPLKD